MPDGTPTWESPTWEAVARSHGRFLYNVAYRLAGNDADAADLAQEALLRVRRGLESYQPTGSLEGWLARIVTNIFLDEVRRKRRRPTVALTERNEHRVPAHAGADVDALQRNLSDDVQMALLGLPDDFRVAVVLCDIVGLSYDEIAEHQGVPVGTVRSRIHRGRAQLREQLS